MEDESKIKVALVRGDSLNEWEGKLWEKLGDNFSVTGYCSKRNLYDIRNLSYPIHRIFSSTDNKFLNAFELYMYGHFQHMYGLEKNISDSDIIHTTELSYFYTMQAIRAKNKRKNIKVVTTVWDNSFGRFEYSYWGNMNPPRTWRQKVERVLGENKNGVDMFLPVSEYSKEMLLSYGVSEEKITILTPALTTRKEEPNDLITEFAGKKVYMMVNRMVKEKGIYDVLYGWSLFMKQVKNTDYILLAVGNGKELENMKYLAEKLGLGNTVKFIKKMSNSHLRSLYRHAQCLILGSLSTPLWQEQFGYVLAEAIDKLCPIISTYSGAIPEVVGSAGILVPPGNPTKIAEGLMKLEEGAYYAKLKQNCEKERMRFFENVFVSRLESVYRKLIS